MKCKLISLNVFTAVFVSGCMLMGESVFFDEIKVTANDSAQDVGKVLDHVKSEFGYKCNQERNLIECSNSQNNQFSESIIDDQQSIISFASFGVPNRQDDTVRSFTATLKRHCGKCRISIRTRSSWGLKDEHSEWVPIE